MHTALKKKIYFWYIVSFLFPPGAWLLFCWFSNLFSLNEVISIAASPLLGIYVIIYISAAVLFLKKKLKMIESYTESEENQKQAQKQIAQLPYVLIILQAIYCIIGPNTGLIGKKFIDSTEYLIGLFSGMQLILGFTALFFIFFTISLEKWAYEVPIPRKRSLGFKTRLFIVSILSSTGIISMIILFVYILLLKNPDIDAVTVLKKSSFIGFLGIGAILLSIMVFANQISRQLVRMKELAKTISKGDVRNRLPVEQRDEIGLVMASLNSICVKVGAMIQDINSHTQDLVSSSENLSLISEKMSADSEQTSEKSKTVAVAAEEMSSNMSSVAASMEESTTNTNMVVSSVEEMNATINEISNNTENARSISQEAVSKVNDSTQKIDELGQAARAIDKVVETITDISEQVNLLSLNATIEAARAGEAGKGFAVVANEIKVLANQTSTASLDIKEKIDNIQSSSSDTLNSIKEINDVIISVNEIVSTIASAVEEQSVTTQEISQNMGQASVGIQDINENVNQSSTVVSEITKDITKVNQSSENMAEKSGQVKMNAEDLSNLAQQLKGLIGQFSV
ncbi:MAG: HAMP domain-containing protein [Desulfobacula sp.]|nr:HAMP domain-containing protein [Desulfobacula sp.]